MITERKKVDLPRPTHIVPNILSHSFERRSNSSGNSRESLYSQEKMKERCEARIRLCTQLEEIDPDNPTWGYAKEFFNVFPSGPLTVVELLRKWRVIPKDKNGRQPETELKPPFGMEKAYPREFIDLDRKTIEEMITGHRNKNQENHPKSEQLHTKDKDLFELAESARTDSLSQYDRLKRDLLTIGGVPLLCRDFIGKMNEAGNNARCLIGMSADESDAHSKLSRGSNNRKALASPLLGINKGFSPKIEERIEKGEVILLPHTPGAKVDSKDLEPGKTYAIKCDITEEVPIKDGQFNIGGLYFWHHIPDSERKSLLTNLVQIAAKKDGQVQIAIFEALRNTKLLQMVLETNSWMGHETAAFDALIGTTACGGQTPESFLNEAKRILPKVNWKTRVYPNLPPSRIFREKILPPQQVGLTGF